MQLNLELMIQVLLLKSIHKKIFHKSSIYYLNKDLAL